LFVADGGGGDEDRRYGGGGVDGIKAIVPQRRWKDKRLRELGVAEIGRDLEEEWAFMTSRSLASANPRCRQRTILAVKDPRHLIPQKKQAPDCPRI
jgi:hypothetical protein